MSCEAFILVGGRSSRLGRDKALERIDGKTLAERALDAVRDAGIADKVVFVTGNDVEFAIEARRLDALFIFDTIEGRGPLGGIYTALAHATVKWIFVLACDLPFVTAEFIRTLARFRAENHGVVVAEQPDGRMQPLCGFYNVAAAKPIVEEIICRPRVPPPMHEIVQRMNPRIVKPGEYDAAGAEPEALFDNVNTENDLELARRLVRGD